MLLKCQLLKEDYLLSVCGPSHPRSLRLSGMEEGWNFIFQEHGFSWSWESAQERAGRGWGLRSIITFTLYCGLNFPTLTPSFVLRQIVGRGTYRQTAALDLIPPSHT